MNSETAHLLSARTLGKLASAAGAEMPTLASDGLRERLAPVISTTFADGQTIEIRSNRPMDAATWARVQALLAPHKPDLS